VAVEEEEDDLAFGPALARRELLDEVVRPLGEGASRHAAGLVAHDLDATGRSAVSVVEALHHVRRELPIGRVFASLDDEGAWRALEEHAGALGVGDAHLAVAARSEGACAMRKLVALVP
jgi:hypothetical protein